VLADNTASVATIERTGGAFDSTRNTPFGPARRYWTGPTR
jgi:predicted acetyltransferase